MSRRTMTSEVHSQIKALLAAGTHYRAIARLTGFSTATVGNIANRDWVPSKPMPTIEEVLGPKQSGGPDPTPAEIAAACEKLLRYRPRARFDEELGDDGTGWMPPIVGVTAARL